MAFCSSCSKPVEYIQALQVSNESWFTVDQVKEICSQCYLNMLKHNITKVKKDVLITALKKANNMTLNELTWVYNGPATSMNLHGRILHPNQPIYLEDSELTLSEDNLKALGIKVSKVEFDKKPDAQQLELLQNRAINNIGIMWVGTSGRRTNEYGTFNRDEARFDLTVDQVSKLKNMPGFKVI